MILLNLRSFGLPDISLAKSFITDEENDDRAGFNERFRISRWETKANEKKSLACGSFPNSQNNDENSPPRAQPWGHATCL